MPDIKYDFFDEEEPYDSASVQPRFNDLKAGIDAMDPPAFASGCLNSSNTDQMVSMARSVEIAPANFGVDPATTGQLFPPAWLDGVQHGPAAGESTATPPNKINPIYWNYTWETAGDWTAANPDGEGVGTVGKQNPPPLDGAWFPLSGSPAGPGTLGPSNPLKILFPPIRNFVPDGTPDSDVHSGIIFLFNAQVQRLSIMQDSTGIYQPQDWRFVSPLNNEEAPNLRQLECSGIAMALQIKGTFGQQGDTDQWFHLRATTGTTIVGNSDLWPPARFRFRRTERRVGVQGWCKNFSASDDPFFPDPGINGHGVPAGDPVPSVSGAAYPLISRDVGIRGMITEGDFMQPRLLNALTHFNGQVEPPIIRWERLRYINGIRAVFSLICGETPNFLFPDFTVVQPVFQNASLSIIMPRTGRIIAINTA